VAMSTTESQGHLAARTAEYAQDKMEQLLALQYPDNSTDTSVFPAVVNPGVGTGLTPGGGLNPNLPVAGYSDYVDASGNPVGADDDDPGNHCQPYGNAYQRPRCDGVAPARNRAGRKDLAAAYGTCRRMAHADACERPWIYPPSVRRDVHQRW